MAAVAAVAAAAGFADRLGRPLALPLTAALAGAVFAAVVWRGCARYVVSTLPQPAGETRSRQLAVQVRLHHWLHGWLLVHVPLSMALLLLSVVHAIVTLRY